MGKPIRWIAASTLALCAASRDCAALDGMSALLGRGDGTDMVGIGLQWEWQKTWFEGENWRLGGYWDASLAYWRAHTDGHSSIVDVGVTPVFRLAQQAGPLFLEGAIGAHFLSHATIDDNRHLGDSFQFGDHVAAGFRFGGQRRYEIAYRFQHLSNGGLKEPNQGVNFHQLRLAWRW